MLYDETGKNTAPDKDVFQIEDNHIRCAIPFDNQVPSQIEKGNVDLNKTETKTIHLFIKIQLITQEN